MCGLEVNESGSVRMAIRLKRGAASTMRSAVLHACRSAAAARLVSHRQVHVRTSGTEGVTSPLAGARKSSRYSGQNLGTRALHHFKIPC